MILHHQLHVAPVRAADAVPTQQRLEQERRARLERMRRAAVAPVVSAASAAPVRVRRARVLPEVSKVVALTPWPDFHDLVPYESGEFGPPPPRRVTAREIIDQVTIKHGISRADLAGASRRPAITAARREVSWRIRQEVLVNGRQISLPEIARHLGGRDHTTVLYNIRRYEADLAAGIVQRASD